MVLNPKKFLVVIKNYYIILDPVKERQYYCFPISFYCKIRHNGRLKPDMSYETCLNQIVVFDTLRILDLCQTAHWLGWARGGVIAIHNMMLS